MKSDSTSASTDPSSPNSTTMNRTRPLATVYALSPVHLPPGHAANITFSRPPGANARRRGSFWASPSPSSRIAASTAAMTSSISISSCTSLSRRIRAIAGRIATHMSTTRPLNVGLIGLGTVGSQVAERMLSWGPQLSRRAGVELCLKRVLVRDPAKRRSIEISSGLLTSKPSDLLDDPAIEVLIEVAGGDEPIRSYIEQAIRAGKHVITANKVVMAKHGPEPVDFRYARELGYAIKLIAHTQRHPGRVEARVHPAMISLDHPLARVEGAENAVFVEGDLVGQVLLVGQGAGGRPTASAVVGDLIDLARSIRRGVQSRPSFSFDDRIGVVPIGEVQTRAYYRLHVDDKPGVLAAIGQVFAEEGVSISSFIQKDAWSHDMTVELVVTTHPSLDASLQNARERMARLEAVRAVSSFLRVF